MLYLRYFMRSRLYCRLGRSGPGHSRTRLLMSFVLPEVWFLISGFASGSAIITCLTGILDRSSNLLCHCQSLLHPSVIASPDLSGRGNLFLNPPLRHVLSEVKGPYQRLKRETGTSWHLSIWISIVIWVLTFGSVDFCFLICNFDF